MKWRRSAVLAPGIQCSFRLVRVLESDSALHQEPGHGPPLAGEQPHHISSRIVGSAVVRALLTDSNLWRDFF